MGAAHLSKVVSSVLRSSAAVGDVEAGAGGRTKAAVETGRVFGDSTTMAEI